MAKLSLSFLGFPEVRLDRERLAFRTRKSLAILIYLVVETGYLPREKLTALLWSESDTRRAQMSFRRALASLRKTLGDTDAIRPPFVFVQGDTLGFNFNADHESDVAELATAVQLTRPAKAVEKSRHQDHLQLLQSVMELYRGDFLEGFRLRDAHGFDAWAGLQREVFHRQMDLIFDRLSQLQFDIGQMASALETTQRWVMHNTLNEAAYRRLMQVHFSEGRRADALETFESCKSIMATELGLEPAPETLALAERIRAEAMPSALVRVRRRLVSEPQSTLLRGPFVGRAAEHGKLAELYHTIRGAQPQVATLVGDAGIGKTRLASEFLSWATAQGALVLSGHAFETTGDLPFQPWTELLRGRTVQEALTQDLLSKVWLGELSRLLPELMDRFKGISPLKVDESAAQARLFESVAKLGAAMADRAPLVILIDDFQWADSASLDLLHYAARRWADGRVPVLLLLSARSEALATKPVLAEWLTRLGRDLPTTTLKLEPLSYDSTHQWIEYLAGDSADPEILAAFSAWLHAETGGQPFYIAEMIAALLERGVLYPYPGKREGIEFQAAVKDLESWRGFIPPGVREVIVARLVQLPADALTLLSAGAVLGHRFNLELLGQVADFPEAKTLEALDPLMAVRLFEERRPIEVPGDDRPLTFAHDKIRDVAYTETGAAKRRIFHQRALRALMHLSAPAAELALHATAAGMAEPAFHYNVAAGDEALALAATKEAITNYARALDLFERGEIGQLASEQLIHLYTNLGRAMELSGCFSEALLKYDQLEAVGRQLGDRSIELAALLNRVTLHAMPNPNADPVQARVLSERALELSRDLDDRAAEAKLLWSLSHVYRLAGQMTQAIDSGERSLALARSLNLKEQMAFTLNDLGSHCYLMSGYLDKAMASLKEASELWQELGNLPMLVDSLASMALTCSFSGEFERVLTLSEEALQISHTTGNLWGQAFSQMQVGFVFWEMGQPDQAITSMEESIRLSEAAGFSVPQALTRATLAFAYGSLGALERSLELAHLALTAAENSIPHSHRYVLAVLAQLHLLAGNLAEAKDCLEQAQASPNSEAFPIFFIPVSLAECELTYRQGEYPRALNLSKKLLADVTQLGMLVYLPGARFQHGKILLALSQLEAAKECMSSACAAAEAIGSRQALWPALLALAKLESNPRTAQNLRLQAREIVEDILARTKIPDLRASFLNLALVQEALNA